MRTAIALILLASVSCAVATDPPPAAAPPAWHQATEHDAELVARLSAYLGRSSSTAVADPDLCSDDGGTCCSYDGQGRWCCCSFTLGCRCGLSTP
jgi:hypothetical protein